MNYKNKLEKWLGYCTKNDLFRYLIKLHIIYSKCKSCVQTKYVIAHKKVRKKLEWNRFGLLFC